VSPGDGAALSSVQAQVPPWLPPRAARLIAQTVVALAEALGPRLEAAILVGAAMNPARQDRARAPEILAIAAPEALEDLTLLSLRLREFMLQGVRVRALTHDELAGSCDVFALEVADWKDRHRLLHGRDPLPALSVSPAHLRHALETELRGLSRRIRNRVLAGLATDQRRDDPALALGDGVDRLTVVAHHALLLAGEAPPREEAALLSRLAACAGADAGPLLEHLARLRSGDHLEPAAALHALLQVVQPATAYIDRLTPCDPPGRAP
jgi:hypothetical protein